MQSKQNKYAMLDRFQDDPNQKPLQDAKGLKKQKQAAIDKEAKRKSQLPIILNEYSHQLFVPANERYQQTSKLLFIAKPY